MKTQEQITARIKEVENRDFFGFERGDLIDFLTFENAKPFLNDDATADAWGDPETDPRAKIVDYLPFAWDKANGCRGLSAGRSMCHMSAWLWLMGEDDLAEQVHHYEFYGKPHLVKISEMVGFDWRSADDNAWRRNECDDGITADRALAA